MVGNCQNYKPILPQKTLNYNNTKFYNMNNVKCCITLDKQLKFNTGMVPTVLSFYISECIDKKSHVYFGNVICLLMVCHWSILPTCLSGIFKYSVKYHLAFYHSLCLKGRPWSCRHPLGSLSDHLTEQTRTNMSEFE